MKKLLYFFFLVPLSFFAQSPISIEGRIRNASGETLPMCHVRLCLVGSDSVVAGAASDNEGFFQFSALAPQRYVLKISSVGYHLLRQEIDARASWRSDSLVLQEDIQLLGAVTVQGSRPPLELKNGSLVAHVQGTILASLDNTFRILEQIPTVVVGSDQQISVFGKGSPLIYLDHRQLRDLAELSTLNPKNIASIELLRNPGAKYPAHTKSVLIIRTAKNKEDGFSGRLFAYGQTGIDRFSYGPQAYLNYRRGGLNVYATGGYSSHSSSRKIEYAMANQDTAKPSHEGAFKMINENPSLWYSVGADYSLNEHHHLGILFKQNHSREIATVAGAMELFSQQQSQALLTDSRLTNQGSSPYLTLYYNGKISQRLSLEVDADYYNTRSNGQQDVLQTEMPSQRASDIRENSQSHYNLWAGKATMNYAFKKNGHLSVGAEFSQTQGTGHSRYEDSVMPSNESSNHERLMAGFVSYSTAFANDISLQVGLRLENVDQSFLSTLDSAKKQQYTQLFPSISLSIPLSKSNSLSISFTSQTDRPAFRQLTSSVDYVNPFYYEIGNPQLKAAHNYAASLSALLWGLYLNLEYLYVDQYMDLALFSFTDDADILFSKPINYNNYQQLSASVSYRFEKIFQLWNGKIDVNYYKPFFQMEQLGEKIKRNRGGVNVAFNNNVQLPWKCRFYANFRFASKGDRGVSQSSASTSLTLGLNRRFLKDQSLSCSLWLIDVFRNKKTISSMSVGDYRFDVSQLAYDIRRVSLEITYTFNRYKNAYKGNGASDNQRYRL